MRRPFGVAGLVAVLLASVAVGPALAAPPANDLPADAIEVDTLPFTIDQDTTEATVTTDDVGCGAGGVDEASVWYAFAPTADVAIDIDVRASDYLVGVNVFAGSPTPDGLIDCNNDQVRLEAVAGEAYWILFADVNEDGIDGGHLAGVIDVAPPAIDIDLTIDDTGLVHPKTGQARVTGTLTCDREAEFADVAVTLRLANGRFITIGQGASDQPTSCGPDGAPWAAIVTGENDRYVGGKATVEAIAFACDAQTCSDEEGAGDVRLRRGRFDLPEPEPEPEPEGTVAPPVGIAAIPANDDIATPTDVTAIPFRDELDTTGATTGPTDPGYCFAPDFGPDPATVWYRYTATESGELLATTVESDYDTTLYLGQDDGAGGMTVLDCTDDGRTTASTIRFEAVAGETYLFMVGASPFGGGVGGNLVFRVMPPAQDVTLDVDPRASFRPDGTAVVRGTVSCTAPADLGAIVIVELDQRVGKRHFPSTSFLDIAGCPADEIAFEIEATSPYGRYAGGRATAQVIFAACNEIECGNETVDLVLRLRR